MTEERNEPTNPAEESPELDARLNQIETATEEDSNVNEDFVHWLKTSFRSTSWRSPPQPVGTFGIQDWGHPTRSPTDAWREFRGFQP